MLGASPVNNTMATSMTQWQKGQAAKIQGMELVNVRLRAAPDASNVRSQDDLYHFLLTNNMDGGDDDQPGS